MFKNVDGGYVKADANTTGYTKPGYSKPHGEAFSITLNFAEVGIFAGSTVSVFDIWQQKVVATTNATNYTQFVPWQGTAFLRLSTVPTPAPAPASPATLA